ncbi:hypothetical protein FG147_09055 [Thauera sp. UPWRP]|nr:hypothetical protein FG147_09055 [Thauera sp. UPWRP]
MPWITSIAAASQAGDAAWLRPSLQGNAARRSCNRLKAWGVVKSRSAAPRYRAGGSTPPHGR